MRFILSSLLCLLLVTVPGALSAATQEWTAAKATAQVSYTIDKENWIPLRKGMTVPNKAWISTGPRGRLQLVRGTESIAFQPNTMAAIVTRGTDRNRKTEIVQQIGEISLEIEKRQQPHTTVQTPFLAAVVKGTRFTVEVGETEAAVAVDRGLVQVTSFRSGERSDLGAGQGARVDAAGMTVAGISAKPSITRATPTAPLVPAFGTSKAAAESPKGKSAEHAAGGKPDKSSDHGKRDSSNNSGGHGKGGGHENAAGNGKGGGHGKAGGNGKGGGHGNGGGNGKGGDNGNASGNGNSNAGGKGNAGGNGNSDRNGNGHGNAGGHGRSEGHSEAGNKDKGQGRGKGRNDD